MAQPVSTSEPGPLGEAYDPGAFFDEMQTEAYVRVAVGRDYGDVPPTKGIYKGAARETLSVRVSVQAL